MPAPTPLARRSGRVKKIMRHWLLASALFGASQHAALGSEPATIEWYMIDLPPIQILSGTLRGKGYTDLIRWRLIAELSNYRHELRIANVQRILADTKAKPNVCNTAWMFTPEREAFMIYAEALHAQLPNGAVILKQRRKELRRFIAPDGTLELDGLIERGNGTVANQSGRSYGVVLDGLVEKARQNNHLVTLTSSHPVESKLGLLKKERVEAALLYPIELTFHLGSSAEEALYDFLPVEGNGTYTLNYLACSKSPLGAKVIEESNRVIAQERNYFAVAYREWLPASLLKLHEAHHQSAFKTPLRIEPLKATAVDDAIAACLLGGGAWYKQKCETGSGQSGG